MAEKRLLKQALLECFQTEQPLDRILQSLFREHHAGSEERRWVSSMAMMFFRFLPMFDLIPFETEKREWQHSFTDALDEFLEKNLSESGWLARHGQMKPSFEDAPMKHLTRLHALPNLLRAEVEPYAEPWHELFHEFYNRAPTTLRVNPLKISDEEFRKYSEGWGVEPSAHVPHAFHLPGSRNFSDEKLFQTGAFEIQDEHSQLVSLFSEPQEGMRILDMCAGAGGKTLHLASLMKNRGEIVAHDVSTKKLHILEQRARRAGFTNIRVQTERIRLKGLFDLILVDAPCSGLGTLRRSPDRWYFLRGSDFQKVERSQAQIVCDAFTLLGPKGRLVYATCTMRPTENIRLIRSICADRALTSPREIFSRVLGPTTDKFMTLVENSPAFRLSEIKNLNEAVQLGPDSRTSGGLRGDAFFMARVN